MNMTETSSVDHQGTEPIDEDIQHTVLRLFHVKTQTNNLMKGRKEGYDEIVRRALQAERNHWKDRLQMSMQEIDRHHKVILAMQSGLQELVKSLRYTLQRNVIYEDEEEEEDEDLDNATIALRLMENLKFQVKQLKVKAGVTDVSKNDYESAQNKQKVIIKDLKEKVKNLEQQRETYDQELTQKAEKIVFLQKENVSLHKQLTRLQKIVQKYNESHSGANFHLHNMDAQAVHEVRGEMRGEMDKRASMNSLSTFELSDGGHGGMVRQRTYIEGDQMVSYPTPQEENAIIKDRLRKNIYSARKGDNRSNNVAQCIRCHALFKPAENNHKSCRFHHKGREIMEQFDSHGKLEKTVYKWACCKKSIDTQGCCFGYHV
ncbi:uncharacterized protein LOC127871991 [Dreissena polymorpha]|uniref:Uncharacterized protein n=1 Tax=Dreissena polymorpha TaxID=45954 RepID=A0A9D4LJB9_DREPO|nr:uncharacterized protein LOC127871991 [Dreissena polymorpha]KAH3859790.1 hypothetical protein DPMN_102613 [Dreissena polymorpha]